MESGKVAHGVSYRDVLDCIMLLRMGLGIEEWKNGVSECWKRWESLTKEMI